MDVKMGRSLGYIASVLFKTTELSDHEILGDVDDGDYSIKSKLVFTTAFNCKPEPRIIERSVRL